MRRRCFSKNLKVYKYYGAIGVTVCDRWSTFENFLADMGPRPAANYVLARNGDVGNYEPGNCQWKTKFENDSEAKRGVRNPNTKFTEDDIREIRLLSSQGLTDTNIAKCFKVNQSTISRIIKRKTWAHVI